MTRIIGIGSPFGADQLGWLAIDHLQTCQLTGCELIKLDRPGSGLLDYFRGVDHVVLIDALISSGSFGDVKLIEPDELEDCDGLTSCHGFGVAEALGLADQLGLLPSKISLIGIHAQSDLSRLPSLDTRALERQVNGLI
ncbi:MAG: hydrogenase maturation protease [Candidatus Thiodiazotropha sp. L084R]